MGAELCSAMINRAAQVLFDGNNIKWPRAELLQWLSDGQRALVSLVPEASSKVAVVQLAAGVRQTLPSDAYMLLEISRNMGTSGATSGRGVKRQDRQVLEETDPNWAFDTATTAVTGYMYNARDRLAYWVYPPSDGTGYVEVIYSQLPAVPAETNTIAVADTFIPALLDYMLWRAKSKAVLGGNPDEAQAYYASFKMYCAASAGGISKLAGEMGDMRIAPPQGQGSA